MTEENKQSGYAKFYQIKMKQLNNVDFSTASKLISEAWKGLDEQEKQIYVKEVVTKRKELLKKKASEQAIMVSQSNNL